MPIWLQSQLIQKQSRGFSLATIVRGSFTVLRLLGGIKMLTSVRELWRRGLTGLGRGRILGSLIGIRICLLFIFMDRLVGRLEFRLIPWFISLLLFMFLELGRREFMVTVGGHGSRLINNRRLGDCRRGVPTSEVLDALRQTQELQGLTVWKNSLRRKRRRRSKGSGGIAAAVAAAVVAVSVIWRWSLNKMSYWSLTCLLSSNQKGNFLQISFFFFQNFQLDGLF